jgi:hypothetical protein
MNEINTNENAKQGGGQLSPPANGPTGSPSAPGATPGKIMSLPEAGIKLHDAIRHAVTVVLQGAPDLSDRGVAALLTVSPNTVSKIREQMTNVGGTASRVGRDGKRRKMPSQSQRGQTPPSGNNPPGTPSPA